MMLIALFLAIAVPLRIAFEPPLPIIHTPTLVGTSTRASSAASANVTSAAADASNSTGAANSTLGVPPPSEGYEPYIPMLVVHLFCNVISIADVAINFNTGEQRGTAAHCTDCAR